MKRKKRLPYHRLTDEQVAEIIALYVGGESGLAVARRFGITLGGVKYRVKKAGKWEGKNRTIIYPRRPRKAVDWQIRFWSRIQKSSGCWIWQGCKDIGGYGMFPVPGIGSKAHRIAWTLLRGPVPIGLVVDHLCSNPACVNPEHLEPVTQRENIMRTIARGRRYPGRARRASVLTE